MKRVLIVSPTAWDAKQLAACRAIWADRFDLEYGAPADGDCAWDFDALGYIERVVRSGGIDGVFSSSDYPGAPVAAAIAGRLGLPGPTPRAVLGCSHKYTSRLLQRRVLPDLVPRFELIDPDHVAPPALGFPCFVKPIKGTFSIMSGRTDDAAALQALLGREAVRDFRIQYVNIFNQLVRAFTDLQPDGGWFLAEELLHGRQVTLEGFACGDRVEILGIVDSEMYPGTNCFRAFVLPSTLPAEVQARMRDAARRLVRAAGLVETFFNIEMMYDAERDTISIIEINPRMCGQFADLYEKVLGVNAYALALELATGGRPRLQAGAMLGRHDVAASYALRTFAPVRVAHAPTTADVEAAAELFPDTHIWPECVEGQSLCDFDAEDGQSCRYAIVNLGAPNRSELEARARSVQTRLGYAFQPL